jgi:hypothetical protein
VSEKKTAGVAILKQFSILSICTQKKICVVTGAGNENPSRLIAYLVVFFRKKIKDGVFTQ